MAFDAARHRRQGPGIESTRGPGRPTAPLVPAGRGYTVLDTLSGPLALDLRAAFLVAPRANSLAAEKLSAPPYAELSLSRRKWLSA